MKNYTPFFFTLFLCVFFACSKGPHFTPIPPPPPIDSVKAEHCFDFTITDSGGLDKVETFTFDSANKLVRHFVHWGYDNTKDWGVIFTYENGNMVKSYMFLGYNNTTIPYTTSEYTYNGNVPATSKYYLGDTLLVHSEYTFDNAGNLATYAQYTDNTTYQIDFSYVANLHYDSHSNLIAVTDQHGDTLESYSDFDTHPNPFYRLPYDFAYDVTHFFNNYFSKNNYHWVFDQFNGINRFSYAYKYDSTTRISQINSFNSFNPADPVPMTTLYISYKCKP